MNYCKNCLMPDTRPGGGQFKDGLCHACLFQLEVPVIDWEAREQELQDIAEWAKKTTTSAYDCVIGVSGGKDSTFQTLYARDRLGLRPLLVNSEPEGITDLGRANIENLINLGFDTIKLRPNPQVMKKLVKKCFYKYLNPVKITEYSLWASAYIMADAFDIPLIIQGENPVDAIGSDLEVGAGGNAMRADKQDTLSTDWKDFIDFEVSAKDLFLFHYDRERMEKKGIKGVWLGYYTKEWSQPRNAKFAMAHGLKVRTDFDPYDFGTYYSWSQLDGDLTQVNEVLKWVKFGFGACTENACFDIWDKRITREEGIALVREFDGWCSQEYIRKFCDYIDITLDEFWQVANSFRGPMWEKKGGWTLKNPIWRQEPPGYIDIGNLLNRLDANNG